MTRHSRARGLTALLVCASAIAACFQPLDRGAARGSSTEGASSQVTDTPTDFATPPIDLDDGGTTKDPCIRTRQRSLAIRQMYCASCHAPPAKFGGFDFVLDDARLASAVSSTSLDDAGKPMRLIIPGKPSESNFYQRVIQGQMPPAVAPPLPPTPTPTVSEFSELHEWIANCLGEKTSPTVNLDAGFARDGGDASP